eukprot:CAMPEP_0175337132 /NCGR_PEP_ID=MMETSP0095-20121207/4168_1 /TAXON_ID=311494 /ORGANISM="Alexandrium monilatum, Strain CCMP3105" /LENGTH=116 /DNA_ID=CAMNT_0016634507 /DNA_START=75 /DNA_END=425 /DNA_ORIENTATION=-
MMRTAHSSSAELGLNSTPKQGMNSAQAHALLHPPVPLSCHVDHAVLLRARHAIPRLETCRRPHAHAVAQLEATAGLHRLVLRASTELQQHGPLFRVDRHLFLDAVNEDCGTSLHRR